MTDNRRRIIVLAVFVIAGIGVATYSYVARPAWAMTAYVVGLWATGHAEGCTLAACVDRMSTRIAEQEKLVVRDSRLIETTPDGFARWSTPLGEFYSYNANVTYLVAEQMAGAYDVGTCRVKPGDVVVDAGANIGTFTRRALNAGASLVVAIEVDPRNIAGLRRTFAREIERRQMIVVDQGLWERDDTLTLHLYDNSALSSLVMTDRMESTAPATQVVVPLTTLDRLVAQLGLTKVDHIKIDIEGAERQALRGAEATIRRFRPQLAIATENLVDDISVLPALVDSFKLGYTRTNGPCRIVRPPFVVRPEVVCFSQQ